MGNNVVGTTPELPIRKKKREANFELLRIVSMLMIVTLHYLGKGRLLYDTVIDGRTYCISWIIECFCYVAVNCYILLSCYFSASKKLNLGKMINLWVQVIFIYLLCCVFMKVKGIGELSPVLFRQIFTPITSNTYWFVTCYFVYMIFSPFLIWVTENINQRQHKLICTATFVVFSLGPSIFFIIDYTKMNRGYSILLFIMLHFIGSYIHKYDIGKRKPIFYFALYALCSILFFFYIYFTRLISGRYYNKENFIFPEYNAVFVVMASIFLFLLFKNIKVKSKIATKVILFFSPLTFSVYLIHENPLIRNYIWKELIDPMSHLGFPDLIYNFILGTFGVFLVCAVLGWLCELVLKILHIPQLCNLIAGFMSNAVLKIWNRSENKREDCSI